MSEKILSLDDIQKIVRPLAEKYHISEVYIFGSYARNEATANSDIDFLVFGGKDFKLTSVFAFAEELRMIIQKEIDVFEINEVNENSQFYKTIMREKLKVAQVSETELLCTICGVKLSQIYKYKPSHIYILSTKNPKTTKNRQNTQKKYAIYCV